VDLNPALLVTEDGTGSGSGSGSRVLMTKKILQLKKLKFFDPKLQFTYPLGLHKGRLTNRRSLQPSKENIQHFKTFQWDVFALLNPDPDQIGPKIHADPDPKHWTITLRMRGEPRHLIRKL
jgi:hypothetical protein